MNNNFFSQLIFVADALMHTDATCAINEILPTLKDDPDVQRVFFTILDKPEWLRPLAEQGFFHSPPEPIELNNGAINYPSWPAMKYLIKSSDTYPDYCTELVANLRTNNLSVVHDIIELALKLPPKNTAKLAETIIANSKSVLLWVNPKQAASLCTKLVANTYKTKALELADHFFSPQSSVTQKSRTDDYWYRAGTQLLDNQFLQFAPDEYFHLVCKWLNDAISNLQFSIREDGYDYSDSWRPAIEPHQQNISHDIPSTVTGHLRTISERSIESKITSLPSLIARLNSNKLVVFTRVGIHLVNQFAIDYPDLACLTILDLRLLHGSYCKHEYAQLIKKRFGILTRADRDLWFKLVLEGPRENWLDQRIDPDSPDSNTQRNLIQSYWILARLDWAKEYLTDEQLSIYTDLVNSLGEPEHSDLNSYFSMGPAKFESPYTLEHLSAQPVAEVIDLIQTWKEPRSESHNTPTHEGFATTLSSLIASDPVAWASHAMSLEHLHPFYLRTYLRSLETAIDKQLKLDYNSITRLTSRLVTISQTANPPPLDSRDQRMIDNDWRWLHAQISDLLSKILKVHGLDLSETDLSRIWETIFQLVITSDQSSNVYEESEHYLTKDYTSLAINSPHGQAVQAAFVFARTTLDPDNRINTNYLPKLKQLVSLLLSKSHRNPISSAIIGESFSTIYRICPEWATEISPIIFNLNATDLNDHASSWSSWNSFVSWNTPHILLYNILSSQYEIALRSTTELATVPDKHPAQPPLKLIEHLIILYGRGDLGDSPKSTLIEFLLNDAPTDIRVHAFEFLGRSIFDINDLPVSTLKRFKELWNSYSDTNLTHDVSHIGSSPQYGYFLASPHFLSQWSLTQLIRLSKLVGVPQPAHLIAEQLHNLGDINLHETLELLDVITRSQTPLPYNRTWEIQPFIDPSYNLLSAGLDRNQPTTVQSLSKQIIDRLGRFGYMQFGTLVGFQWPVQNIDR